MTRPQLDELIRIHTAQRDFAKQILDERYFELEKRGEEQRWLNRYIYHKKIVEALEQEQPDD